MPEMRHSRLAEIDLARAMTVDPGPALETEMRTYNAGGGAWSYEPARSSTADLVGAATPLTGPLHRVPWHLLAAQIEAACNRGLKQQQSNVEVGNLLYQTALAENWSAVKEPMGRLSVGFGESLRYWADIVIADRDGPFIPFFDHRRGRGLASAKARRIVFSMQHIGVRERNPDLANARLAIVRFPATSDSRSIVIDFHNEEELLSYEELDEKVRIVYETWARVSDERAAKRRSAGGG